MATVIHYLFLLVILSYKISATLALYTLREHIVSNSLLSENIPTIKWNISVLASLFSNEFYTSEQGFGNNRLDIEFILLRKGSGFLRSVVLKFILLQVPGHSLTSRVEVISEYSFNIPISDSFTPASLESLVS